MAEGGARAIAGIGQHQAEPHPGRPQAIHLGERNRALAAGNDRLVRHPRCGATRGVVGPLLWQEQPQAERDRHLPIGERQRNQRLAVRPLAQLPTILPRHPHRESALLRQRRVVDHQHRLRTADHPVRLLRQHRPQRAVIPGRAGDEVLQLVVPAQSQLQRHRLQAFALARAEQAAHIERRPGSAASCGQAHQGMASATRPDPAPRQLPPPSHPHAVSQTNGTITTPLSRSAQVVLAASQGKSLPPGVEFVQKPHTGGAIAAALRRALGGTAVLVRS